MAYFKRDNKFLVCIDSDGCAFDAMEIKHKECFTPNFIATWGLQSISKYARETWEFVNLYSRWRGVNRFPALIKAFDFLSKRKVVKNRGFIVPDLQHVKDWLATESKPGNPALEKAIERNPDEILIRALEWSRAVNEDIKRIVHGVPPFPFVRESITKLSQHADAVVMSATPIEALEREWEEHDLKRYMKFIFGQEHGTKAECIRISVTSGEYENCNVLMIGDAIGDLEAARENNVRFYPIIPGREEQSWEKFYREELDKFINSAYTEEHEKELVDEFFKCLPEVPSWKE